MRLIVDSLIALMLVAILATVILHYRHEHRELEQIRFVHESLARLHEQATFHRAMTQVQHARDTLERPDRAAEAEAAFPERISPEWFDGTLPLNVLVPTRHPWLDLAPPGDHHDHPPDPVLESPDQAGFWYNPQRGIFRARVPAQFSSERTLALYNRVNGTALLALPSDNASDREPRSHSLTPEPERRQSVQVLRTHEWDEHLDFVSLALPTMLSLDAPEADDEAAGEGEALAAAGEQNGTPNDDAAASPNSAEEGERATSSHRPTLRERAPAGGE